MSQGSACMITHHALLFSLLHLLLSFIFTLETQSMCNAVLFRAAKHNHKHDISSEMIFLPEADKCIALSDRAGPLTFAGTFCRSNRKSDMNWYIFFEYQKSAKREQKVIQWGAVKYYINITSRSNYKNVKFSFFRMKRCVSKSSFRDHALGFFTLLQDLLFFLPHLILIQTVKMPICLELPFLSAKKDHKTMISSQIKFCCLGPRTQPSC